MVALFAKKNDAANSSFYIIWRQTNKIIVNNQSLCLFLGSTAPASKPVITDAKGIEMRNVSGLYDRGTPLTLICTVTQGTSYHFSPIFLFFLSICVFICLDDQGQRNKSHISLRMRISPSPFSRPPPPPCLDRLFVAVEAERTRVKPPSLPHDRTGMDGRET